MPVDRCILTPTYTGHFRYIPKYLVSFRTFVRDRDFPIHFIVNRDESPAFERLIAPFRDLNLTVHLFEDILAHFHVPMTPGLLLDQYGKFTFQSLKKWYGLLYIEPRQSLMLDSESMWVHETDMGELFDDYFAAPFLAYSDINIRRRAAPLFLDVVKNHDLLFGTRNAKWFLEHFCWFYDLAILRDLFADHGSPLDMADALYRSPTLDWALFETLFYHEYIYNHNDRYGYEVVDVDKALAGALGPEGHAAYRKRFYDMFRGEAGVLEYATAVVRDEDYEAVARLFRALRFRILRCEFPRGNYAAQKGFMDAVRPNICAVSQEHVFGLNQGRVNRLLEAVPDLDLAALRNHGAAFAAPVRNAADWLREGALTTFHGSGAMLRSLRHEWRTRGRRGQS